MPIESKPIHFITSNFNLAIVLSSGESNTLENHSNKVELSTKSNSL